MPQVYSSLGIGGAGAGRRLLGRVADAWAAEEIELDPSNLRVLGQRDGAELWSLAVGIGAGAAGAVVGDILCGPIGKGRRNRDPVRNRPMGEDQLIVAVVGQIGVVRLVDEYSPAIGPIRLVERCQIDPPPLLQGLRTRQVDGGK